MEKEKYKLKFHIITKRMTFEQASELETILWTLIKDKSGWKHLMKKITSEILEK